MPDNQTTASTDQQRQALVYTDQPTRMLSLARWPSLAHWDMATDVVTFDWPAIIEASQFGPKAGTAKILLAARAAGKADQNGE